MRNVLPATVRRLAERPDATVLMDSDCGARRLRMQPSARDAVAEAGRSVPGREVLRWSDVVDGVGGHRRDGCCSTPEATALRRARRGAAGPAGPWTAEQWPTLARRTDGDRRGARPNSTCPLGQSGKAARAQRPTCTLAPSRALRGRRGHSALPPPQAVCRERLPRRSNHSGKKVPLAFNDPIWNRETRARLRGDTAPAVRLRLRHRRRALGARRQRG